MEVVFHLQNLIQHIINKDNLIGQEMIERNLIYPAGRKSLSRAFE
uniref:Uncharacterized protein n=1 Tax=Meloidogyne enterolobii TaxID=390850 RepID=A0A6V7X260_MELEN|nr:unnamed protein product [Meloidogyne enterolobii]